MAEPVSGPLFEPESEHNLAPDAEGRISSSGRISGQLESDSYGEDLEARRVLKPGEVLSNRYEVLSFLGSGGMGVVYKVKQARLHKYFALKTVRSPYLSEQAITRFRKEAKAASALNHPGLITVYDFGLLEDGQPFMVMDLVESGSLLDAIKRLGRLPIDRVLDIFVKASGALEHAHEHKIIHRDLKPGNILLDDQASEEQRVRIADFGVAKILEDDSGSSLRLTQTGEIVGSPLYMSPEQCAGRKADERSDIYSLGCTMFEALTGRPPFVGETALATMLLHQKQAPISLAEAVPAEHFPERLEEVCARALAKDPDDRYQSMSEFQQALLDVNASPPSTDKKKSARRSQTISVTKRQTVVPLSVVAMITLAAILVSSLITSLIVRSAPPVANSQVNVSDDRAPNAEGNFALPGRRWLPPTEESERTSKIGGKRVFHFDERGSMGCLYPEHSLNEPGVSKWEAIGKVSIPEDVRLRYRPNWAVPERPDVFDRLGSDDLYAIDFANLPITDPVLEHIQHLKGLHALILNNTEVTDSGLRYLLDLPNLEELSVANTDVTSAGIASLSRLKTLKRLVIISTRIDARALDFLRQATQLEFLILKNAGMTSADLEAISGLKNLTSLCLDRNKKITSSGMKYLTGLSSLNVFWICDSGVGPDALPYFKQMTGLSQIHIWKGQWTASDIATFERELPRVKIVQEVRVRTKLPLDDGK